jgi:hypothetical protein
LQRLHRHRQGARRLAGRDQAAGLGHLVSLDRLEHR